MSSARISRPILLNSLIGISYAALGFAFLTGALLGVSAPLWPPAGLAFAVALRWGFKVMPGVILGSLAANVAAQQVQGDRGSLLTAVIIAVGAGLAAQAGAWLVRRFVGDNPALSTAREILPFLFLAGPVASTVAATIGTGAQVVTDVIPAGQAPLAWLVWWAGDAMGVMVFGPITMMILPDHSRTWDGWRLKIALPSTLFATVLLGALVYSQHNAQQRLDAERAQAALDANASLMNQLDRQQEVLQGIKSLFKASDAVSSQEFRSYTREPLQNYGSLQALSWNVALTSEDLPAFVAARRAQPGGQSFTVTQRRPDGELRPVDTDRERYVVVDYIEPLATNRAALGYDINSNPDRALTIAEATDTGETIGTAPIDLVQANGDSQKGMLVLDPAYRTKDVPPTVEQRRAALQGFAVGVYQFDDMLAEVFEGQLDSRKWRDVAIELRDITDPANPVTIAVRPAANSDAQTLAKAPGFDGDRLAVDGRIWQLALTPLSGPLAAPASTWAPVPLITAVTLTYLLESLLLLLIGWERTARAEALLKSYEAEHDELTGLLNRRGFIDRLEQLCARGGDPSQTHLLLFCDLDDFKRVNDVGGHATGDEMLVAIGEVMRQKVRDADFLARIGGDEFAVVLVNCPAAKGVEIAEKIVEAVRSVRLSNPRGDFSVGVSIGMASITGDGTTDPDVAIQRADDAAYSAKQSRVGVAFYDCDPALPPPNRT